MMFDLNESYFVLMIKLFVEIKFYFLVLNSKRCTATVLPSMILIDDFNGLSPMSLHILGDPGADSGAEDKIKTGGKIFDEQKYERKIRARSIKSTTRVETYTYICSHNYYYCYDYEIEYECDFSNIACVVYITTCHSNRF